MGRRRAHEKSTRGCRTCRQRRVKCDELRPLCGVCSARRLHCVYDPVRSDQKIQPPGTAEAKTLHNQDPRSEVQLIASLTAHDNSPHWPSIESHVLTSLARRCTVIQNNGDWQLGILPTVMPQIIRLSFQYDFVRYAILDFSLTRFAKSEKSSKIAAFAPWYRAKTLAGLQNAISNFSQANSDAVLATSGLLVTASVHKQDFDILQRGLSQVIEQMQPWKEASELPTYFGGPFQLCHASHDLNAVNNTDPAALEKNLIEGVAYLLDRISQVQALVRAVPPLVQAAKNLWIFVYNFRNKIPTEHQAYAALILSDFRFQSFADRFPCLEEFVVRAYYELMAILLGMIRPASYSILLISKCQIIERLHLRGLTLPTRDRAKSPNRVELQELMETPYNMALQYRTTGNVTFPSSDRSSPDNGNPEIPGTNAPITIGTAPASEMLVQR